jgi:hypothetical protein
MRGNMLSDFRAGYDGTAVMERLAQVPEAALIHSPED